MSFQSDKKYIAGKGQFSQKLAEVYARDGETSETVFDTIVKLDPTSTAKGEKHRFLYLEWICSRILKNPPRSQDLYKIREDLELYMSLSRIDKFRASRPGTIIYRPYVNAQIGQYATLDELSNAVFPYINLKDRKKSAEVQDSERAKAEKDSHILYDGSEGRIVAPRTEEASQYWGKNTRWCISATKSDNRFEEYYAEGKYPIIMFLPKSTPEKFAFNEYDAAAGRNAQDRCIYDTETMKVEDETGMEILKDFVTSAVTSPRFNWQVIQDNPSLQRSLQLFYVMNPLIYSNVIAQTGHETLSPIIRLPEIIDFAKQYLSKGEIKLSSHWPAAATADDADADADALDEGQDERQIQVNCFAVNMLQANKEIPNLGKSEQSGLMALVGEDGFPVPVSLKIIQSILSIPNPPLQTADDYQKDYAEKIAELDRLQQNCKVKLHQSADVDHPEMLYLMSIPRTFWASEELALTVVNGKNLPPGLLIDTIPEIFQHPKVWLETLNFIEIAPDTTIFERAKDPRFAHIAKSRVDGVPFFEAVVNLGHACDGRVVSDLTSAIAVYESFGNVEGVDVSPLVVRLEEIYPNGFDTPDEVQLASNFMPKCDLAKLLEKAIARNPGYFEDVNPDCQTLSMVEVAVDHDPEALADVAERFFNGKSRPPILSQAFRRMVEIQSPYIQMVERHFTP